MSNMNKKSIQFVFIIPAICYLFGVFVSLQFDVRLWSEGGRFMGGFIAILLTTFCIVINENKG